MITVLVAFTAQAITYHFMLPHDDASTWQPSSQAQLFDNQIESLNAQQGSSQQKLAVNDSASVKKGECCEVDCCENECICPANSCASTVYLKLNLPLIELVVLSESLLPLAIKQTHFIASLLHRPPIFIS